VKHLLFTFCFILLLFSFAYSQQDTLKNYSLNLEELLDSMNIADEELDILIDKSDYTLSLVAKDLVIKQYPVVFGSNPVDDKLRQGDRCTPEGEFLVRTKYPHRSWEKFIWINYPTEDSWLKHREAKREHKIEESDGIGGEIGIHGVPFGADHLIDQRMNWTLGCISLKNKDVNEFYSLLNTGTRVTIRK